VVVVVKGRRMGERKVLQEKRQHEVDDHNNASARNLSPAQRPALLRVPASSRVAPTNQPTD
jgi:hypothetical protein